MRTITNVVAVFEILFHFHYFFPNLDDKRRGTEEIVERVIREFIKQAPEFLERVLSEPEIAKKIAEFSESVGGIA